MSDSRFPVSNGSGSVFNGNTNNNNTNTTRQHLYPGAFRNYPWPRTNAYLDYNKPLVSRGEPEAPALSLGERVVWLKDSGPEIGTARWIGRLPLVSPDWSVGVEFDRPIGTSDGKFGTKQYFTTRPKHAFFLPIMALMKAEEYNGETTTTFGSQRGTTPTRNQSTWEKSRVTTEEESRRLHHQHHDHLELRGAPNCCNCHGHGVHSTARDPTTASTCYHHGTPKSTAAACFVTSTPRNATRHKSVTIKETVGNVPAAFGEWSDEDDLSKFPFKSWKSSSRQSVVSCPASVGPPTILIAKELTSDSSDYDGVNGKFKTLMACFLPGMGHREKKKKKKKHRKYILASEENKVSFVSAPEKQKSLGVVSGGGDLWPRRHGGTSCDVAASCSAFPTTHCLNCQPASSPVQPPPRKNFSCTGLEKFNSCTTTATPITPLKKKTPAPAPPSIHLHHKPVSPKFGPKTSDNTNKPGEVKAASSTTSVASSTSTRSHRLPVIRSLDAARNEIDISQIATKYTFVGNSARSNSFSNATTKTSQDTVKPTTPLRLNTQVSVSPHPRRNPKKKAPQPPAPEEDTSKQEASPKKRLAPQPPALPKKTTSHDTMTLFGYTPREGLSRTSSVATIETNLDKSVHSDGSAADLLSIEVNERMSPTRELDKNLASPSIEVNLATSSDYKSSKIEDDAKILNTEVAKIKAEVKPDTVLQKEAVKNKVTAVTNKLTDDAGKEEKIINVAKAKEPETSKESKPTMKTSSSQTNLHLADVASGSGGAKTKKNKRKLLGAISKNSSKKKEVETKETKKDEVTEMLIEIEEVVKSKPTVQDFVAAFTKFTEKAEQITTMTQSEPARVKNVTEPVKVPQQKSKLVNAIPAVVTPITAIKEDKKSLKSFPTKWTFNFKKGKEGEKRTLSRNESSPCLESRSEPVGTLSVQSSMPLSRKNYSNDFKEPESQTIEHFHSKEDISQNVGNNAPFIQNRETLRRLSEENRHRHGSTLSLGRFLANQHTEPSYVVQRQSLTPNASPVMSRHALSSSAICVGKPPLPVKAVHETMAEQNKSGNLFSQLEAAIANGQHQKAAVLARELALQKVTGSLTRLKNKDRDQDKLTTVSLYIEDKDTHQGPIPLSIHPKMTVAMLKRKVEEELKFAVDTQRWILGKTFVVNDDSTLGNLDVCTPGCPIFLYIVAGNKEKKKAPEASTVGIESFEALTEMVNKMTAVTRNMLLAEEMRKKAANNNAEALETLQEENVVDIPVAKEEDTITRSASESSSSTENSEASNALDEEVQSDISDEVVEDLTQEESDDNNEVFEDAKQLNYQELMQLEEQDLIANVEAFECPICFLEIDIGEGTVLRDCLHNFCKECLSQAVEYANEAVIKCPFRNNEYSCDSHLLEREIKALVTPEMFEKHLQRSVAAAESKAENSFHCKSPDCLGWCLYEDNVNIFMCPVCNLENCLTCQAIHQGKDCKQYQDEIEFDAAASEDAKKTKEYLDNMVKEGQAMHCPTCRVIVMKKWGCDWLKCSVCQTEICWVTKGPRWGPAGRGDTSAGCKCGVNGVRCHTLCNYCH